MRNRATAPPPYRLHMITKFHNANDWMGICCLQAHEEGQRSSSSSAGSGACVGATLRSMQLRGEVHHIELVLDMSDRQAPLQTCWGSL